MSWVLHLSLNIKGKYSYTYKKKAKEKNQNHTSIDSLPANSSREPLLVISFSVCSSCIPANNI